MKAVSINKEKCIGCGLCVGECVSEKIKLIDGKAEFMFNRCIQCGHCYAVCPTEAVTMNNYEDFKGEKVFDFTEIDSDNLLAAMKSRRTIRNFTDKEISNEEIEKIIEAGRYCPTGTNSQDFSFTVLRDSAPEFEKECVNFFRTLLKVPNPVKKYLGHMTVDDNFFFKGSTAVIVVSGKGSTSSCLASSYMELMAYSMGIGVLYSGFFVAASKLNPKIKKMLNLPKGHSPVTCLVLGYPDVKYQRIPPRNKADIRYL
ncbi:MAG: nitroreductase family protein [Clostridia bacterium]|nr:nitroreductase family protein [Clostridia bacterium]